MKWIVGFIVLTLSIIILTSLMCSFVSGFILVFHRKNYKYIITIILYGLLLFGSWFLMYKLLYDYLIDYYIGLGWGTISVFFALPSLYRESEEEQYDPKRKESKKKNNTFKCSECGALVDENADFCPKCGEKFEDDNIEIMEEKNNENHFEKKYDKLIKLKELLDEDVITKEEFNKEKKKVLNEKE